MLRAQLWPQVSSDVPSGLLGRTNVAFPPVWLRLAVPPAASDLAPLAEAALNSGAPLDVTISPGLWGGYLRGSDTILTCVSSSDFERATDDRHAGDLIQAHLLETLSCVGRESFDIYFLRIRRAVEEYQIAGALESLEAARQEGHVRFLGLACDGPPLATRAMWQFHDAFEVILVPDRADAELAPLARERRVGIVRLIQEPTPRYTPQFGEATSPGDTFRGAGEIEMKEVRTAAQVGRAIVARESAT